MGLAFAIPIDIAMNTVNQIRDKGRVTRGRIGVQIQEVSKEAADSFGLKQAMGALVNSVEKGGPADKAGVEAGDIIVKVDGKDVPSSATLPRIITQVRPGNKVTLTVWRNGATRDIAVVVAEMKDETPSVTTRKPQTPKEKAKPNRMGLVLADLTPEQRKEADVKGGVLVEDIGRGHPRRRSRRRAGGRHHPAGDQQGRDHRGEERGAGERAAREAREGRLGDAAAQARGEYVLLDD
jgi:serine protease Do